MDTPPALTPPPHAAATDPAADAVADEREVLTWSTFGTASAELAAQVRDSGWRPDVVVAVARGGLPLGGSLAYLLDVKSVGTLNVEFYTGVGTTLEEPVVLPPLLDGSALGGAKVLVADDVADTGRTLVAVLDIVASYGAEVRTAVLYEKPITRVHPEYVWRHTPRWINFPWSTTSATDA